MMQLPNSIATEPVAPSLITPLDQTPLLLLELLKATHSSQGDAQGVYPLLVENLDLLEAHFIYVLRNWATLTLSMVSLDEATLIASVLVDLAGIIWALPEGDPDVNLEIAIACCEIALQVYTREELPWRWATVHNNLALCYSTRSHGNPVENTRRAYAHYYQAKEVFAHRVFPEEWQRVPHIKFV